MKKYRLLFIIGVALGLTRVAYAAPCDGSTQCGSPAPNGSQATWTPSASGMTSIQCDNSSGGTGNVTSSKYFFAASSTDQGPTLGKGSLTTTGTGSEVIGSFSFPSGSNPTDNVLGGVVQNLLGNQSYTLYAQACASSDALDSALCSIWIRIGTRATSPYPASVFNAPQAPADATINTIVARPSVPAADAGNISLMRLDIHDLITPANNQTLAPVGFPGNGPFTINNTMYTQNGGFKPNVKYEYLGKVVYPYGVDVPAAGQTRGPFWTTPAQPGAIVVDNITHCSARITANNAAGNPANPAYTTYNLCATGICAVDQVSGGNPTDIAQATLTTLVPGTTYNPNATAQVGNTPKDGTQAGWNSSVVKNGAAFTTSGTAGTFGSANVLTTSGDFTFSGLDLSGVTSYQMIVNGVNFGAQVNAVPVSPIHLAGLIPNTQYTVKIQLFEATCNFTVPTSGVVFTTLAVPPTSFTLSATDPFTLHATWVDGVNATSAYRVQYCTPDLNGACQQVSTASGVLNANLTANPNTTYCAHALTLANAGGVNSAFSNSVCVTTPQPGGPSFSSGPVVNVNPDNKTGTATALGVDGGIGATTISYNWTLVSGPTGGSISVTPNNSTSANNASVTFSKAGTYTIACTISDNFGSKTTNAPPVVVSQILSAITVTPNNVTLKVLQDQMFTANGADQFGDVISALSGVSWSTSGGSVSQAGVFQSSTLLGTAVRVTATKGILSGSAVVTLVNFDVSSAYAYPVPYKANTGTGVIHFVGLGSQSTLHIYTASGRRVFDISLNANTYDWAIKNSSGESIASGVYSYVIESPEGKKNGKLIIIQ